MSDNVPFQIPVGLKSRPKPDRVRDIAAVDAAGADHGFVQREEPRRRGRRPSARTGQVHAKVFPHVSDQIADEAKHRGITQGVLIEEAWALYCKHHGMDGS